MDIRQLKYFIAIAEAGSLSLAARQLNIAQPSLSQHLANMEKELNVRLVARSSRGSTLTAEGRVLLRHAIEISASLAACTATMRDLSAEISGTVRFGMPPSVCMVMAVPLAETVRIELPDVRLRVSEAMSGFIKYWVDNYTVDVGFLYDLSGIEHFEYIHVLNEQLYFFSAPDSWPLETTPGTPVPLRELVGIELVLPSEPHGLRRIIEKAAAEADVRLNVVTELDALTQIKELVARGSSYSIFAPAACHDYVMSGRIIKTPIIDPVISRPVYLVRNSRAVQTRATFAVEKVNLKVAAEMVKRGIWESNLVWKES
ncbi:LysR family transcriptional regulator [Pseudotabrizicola sp. 4114]|uniref:LysR family transcriptional regulator n=1 Tax=Pseudotabrizicola sp. 4114 TaxID=2817731 RepID=UPI0028660C41|nr:LysR family nitrogen assimilation transcriptional regulator [Pseudorhodobacter sp. 4114]